MNTQDYSSVGGTVEAKLRGYVYGANIGWIAFEATGDPRVDLATGQLTGHAYSANAGWIVLTGTGVTVRTTAIAAGADTDGDTMSDEWERFCAAGSLTFMTTLAYRRDALLVHIKSVMNGPAITSCRGATKAVIRSASALLKGFVSAPYSSLSSTPSPSLSVIETNADLSGAWTTQVNNLLPGAGAATLLGFVDSAGAKR